MARRKLSDLLRETAQPNPPSGDPAATEVSTPSASEASDRQPSTSIPDPDLAETIGDLQATIADLQAQLQNSHDSEAGLRAEITTLKAALRDQVEQVQQLNSQLHQIQRDQAELAEAKQLILNLSASNLQLSQQLEAAKNQPAPAAALRSSSVYRELRQILHHPVMATLPSTALSDAEIGWVD